MRMWRGDVTRYQWSKYDDLELNPVPKGAQPTGEIVLVLASDYDAMRRVAKRLYVLATKLIPKCSCSVCCHCKTLAEAAAVLEKQ